jgi:hypothetical protein
MIIAFSGWRDWTDAKFIHRHIEREMGRHTLMGPLAETIHIRVGDQRGADTIICRYFDDLAADLGGPDKPYTRYDADWDRFRDRNPNPAGAIRNRDMLMGHHPDDPMYGHLADLLVAFPEPGRSKPAKGSGTWNAICQAQWRGIEVRIPAYRADIVPDGSDTLEDLWMQAVPL